MFNVKSLIVLTCIAFPMTAFAQSPEEKGLEIAMAAKAYDRGFTDFTANMVMTLKNKSGQTSKRLIRIRSLEVEGDGDKSLSIFDEPADVKGTKMLTYSHGLEADDQWLYLPALKKVKRISSRNKSGPFMGFAGGRKIHLQIPARRALRRADLLCHRALPGLQVFRIHPPGRVDRQRGLSAAQGGVLRSQEVTAENPDLE
jgi:hypothetical protein